MVPSMMRRFERIVAVVVLCAGTAFLSTSGRAADADRGVLARHADKLTAEITDQDADAFTLELAAGGTLGVKLKGAKGGALLPGIALRNPDGDDVDVSANLKKAGTSKPRLKKFLAPVGGTGVWTAFINGGPDNTVGVYTALFKIKNPKPTKVKGVGIPAGGTNSIEFPARKDALITVTLKNKGGPNVPGVRILDEDGTEEYDRADFTEKGKKLRLKKAPIEGPLGTYTMELIGDPNEPSTVDVVVAVKFPKFVKRKVTLGPEATLASVAPAEVKQEQNGVALTLTGTDLANGSTAEVSGQGVTVTNVNVTSGTSATVTVDVAQDAPFGLRDITLIPPLLDGDPVTLAGGLQINAPDPTVTAMTPTIVKQGDAGLVVEVQGTGFRQGGTIDIAGGDFTLGATEFVSDTLARVPVTVPIDAAVGTRDVTWIQPAEGGGASDVGSGLLQVNYPDPSVTAVSSNAVRQEDAGITLTLTGQHFRLGGTVGAGAGVTVSSPTFVSNTSFDITVAVGSAAAFGNRTITYTQPADGGSATGSLTNAFAVNAPIPTVSTLAPGTVIQGDTSVTLTVTGIGFRDGGAISFEGLGITPGTTTVNSDTEAQISVDVDIAASVGLRDVIFTQPVAGGAAAATGDDLLRINYPDPTVTAIAPTSARQEQTGVTLTLSGTDFRDNGTVSFSGTGITPTNPTRVSDTTFTVQVDIAADATFGTRTITYMQPSDGGSATGDLTNGLTIKAPIPTISSIDDPDTLVQGDSGIVVTFTGTGFRGDGMVSFGGTGLTLSSQTFINETTFTVSVNVEDDAPLGPRAAVYTQSAVGGSASGTRAGGLQINAPTPTVTAVAPTIVKQGQSNVTLTVTGTDFRSGGALTISGTGLTLDSTTVASDTSATVDVTVDSDAAVGTRNITFTQPAIGGAAAATGDDLLRINYPDPTVTTIAPTSARQEQTGVTLTLSGTDFRDNGTVSFSETGITPTNPTRVSDTTFTVQVDIAADATFGTRTITYMQPSDGGSATGDLTNGLTIRAPIPTISSIDPDTLVQGDSGIVVTFTGTGFRGDGMVSFGETGLTLSSQTFINETTFTVSVNVEDDAPLGPRAAVYTQSDDGGSATGDLTNGLTIKAPIPTISSIDPDTLVQGDSGIVVTFTGTGFRGDGMVSFGGTGLTLSSQTFINETTFTVSVNVEDDAPLGLRAAVYTQSAVGGSASGTRAGGLLINAPTPTVTAVAPTIVKQGQSNVTLTVTGTGFRTGGALTISGTGLTLDSTTVASDTSATADVTVDVDIAASVGLRDVIFTQPVAGGGAAATGDDLLRINYPDPTVTAIAPTSARQEQTGVTLTLSGTDFRDNGTVSFSGTGITPTNPTRVSDTTFTVQVDIAADATFGTRTITYMQPSDGGSATGDLTNGLTIRAPIPTISSIDDPDTLVQGDSGIVVTFTGTGFRVDGMVSFGGTGLTLSSQTFINETTFTVSVNVEDDAPLGPRAAVYTQSAVGGSASGTRAGGLQINAPTPTVTAVDDDEIRLSDTGTFVLTGTNFRSGGEVSTDSPDVTLSNQTFVSTTSFAVDYSVGTEATLEKFDLTFTQPDAGGAASATLTDACEIFDYGPQFTSIAPATVLPGESHAILRVTGSLFDRESTVSFSGSGLTVHATDFVSPTVLDVDVSAASNASLETRDITITAGTGPAPTFDDKLAVAPADPTVTAFSHETLAQGTSSVSVTITGTNFTSGDTVSASGTGVTFGTITVASSIEITTTASVTGGATVGARDLTVTHSASNGGRSGTFTGALTVTGASPTVTSINPSSIAVTGSGGPTRTVPVTITGTNFMTGATVSISGSGVTVVANSAEVISNTEIECDLSVTGTTGTGTRNVTVTNPSTLGNSGTTGNNKLTINAATTLTVNHVISACAEPHGGERVTIHGGGFAAGDVVDFGTVRGYLAQIIDQNTIIVTVPQPTTTSSTATTSVNVKVTNSAGTSNATLTGGYTYEKDEVRMIRKSVFPAQGATGVPQSLNRACVLMTAPMDTSTVDSSGSTGGDHVFWFESMVGGSLVSPRGHAFGPNDRWLVFTTTLTALPINAAGIYVLDQPSAIQSISGASFEPTRINRSHRDQNTFTISTATDVTAPTVTRVPAASATGVHTTAKITLTFNEEIDPSTVTSTNINLTLNSGGATVGTQLSLSDDLKVVTMCPDTELTHNTVYKITVGAGVKDLHQNASSAASTTFTTTTSTDSTTPTIDSVVIEGLPSDMDGSTTFTTGNDSDSLGQAIASTGTSAFDLLLPRTGFELLVTFSDLGGSGIDPTSFSAKCSVAVGSNAANAELASKFDITPTRAKWRIGASDTITAGDNITFTFNIQDVANNTSSNKVITIDVLAKSATSNHARGGDLDPFNSRDSWVLRTDLDSYTATITPQNSPPRQGATTTVASNGKTDFAEALEMIGLNSSSMTADAMATVNGPDTSTNRIMQRKVISRLREVIRERFEIDEDGTRDADSVEVEFLLAGERGSLTSLPTYGTTPGTNTTAPHSEMSVGGTDGAETSTFTASSTLGRATFDFRNRNPQHDINTGSGSILGVHLMGMFKLLVNAGSGHQFRDDISSVFVAVYGGTPVGEDSNDDEVLAGTFDRSSDGNTDEQNDRYDEIEDAIETIALYVSVIAAHEVGHSLGLVPDGAPKAGLFGWAHRDNTFTISTTTTPNTSHHMIFAEPKNIMAALVSFSRAVGTGTEFKRFNPLIIAYLRRRAIHDEGR